MACQINAVHGRDLMDAWVYFYEALGSRVKASRVKAALHLLEPCDDELYVTNALPSRPSVVTVGVRV